MRRVCIVRRDYYPMVPHVRRDALALVGEGYQVDVVCLRAPGQKGRESVDGVRVHRMPMAKRRGGLIRNLIEYLMFLLLSFLALSFLSLKKRYDAVEVDTMPDFLVFAALVPKLMGSRIVLYLFECLPELIQHDTGLSSDHPLIRLSRWIERYACRFSDHVIYAGQPYREVQEPRIGNPVPGTAVLNVPDESVFQPSRSTPPRADLGGRPFRLISHGSLLERYGVQTLINAVPLMRKEIPDLQVYIVGEGEYRIGLQERSKELGVEETVIFTGWVQPAEVARFVDEADVGVVCFFHQCAIANKLFEYMAMQRPVVHAATRFTMDLCRNGEVLFYTPADEEELARRVVWLYHNTAARLAMVERANAFYQSCRWPVSREHYLNVYRGLLGATASPRPVPVGTAQEPKA